jgi:hypothetical protein
VPEDDAAPSAETRQQALPVHFRYRPIARDMWLNDNVVNLKDPETAISLTIRQQRNDEPNFALGNAVVEVTCVRPVSARVMSETSKTGHLSYNKQAVKAAMNDLNSFAHKTLKAIRWRQGVMGHPNPLRYGDPLHWSLDGENWTPCTDTLRLSTVYRGNHQQWSEKIATSVEGLVLNNQAEPLGHELLHEAGELYRTRNYRSALVIAVAAAEVGFKRFVAELMPECEWLLLNVASPPLAQMLTEFLPLLPVRTKIRDKLSSIPPSIMDQIKKAITLRNQVVHGRTATIHQDTVEQILPSLKDLLYLLDFWLGSEWAWENIRHETHLELVA